MANCVPNAIMKKPSIPLEFAQGRDDMVRTGVDRSAKGRIFDLNAPSQHRRNVIHNATLSESHSPRNGLDDSDHPSHEADTKFDNADESCRKLEFEMKALARIIVDTYNTWRLQ